VIVITLFQLIFNDYVVAATIFGNQINAKVSGGMFAFCVLSCSGTSRASDNTSMFSTSHVVKSSVSGLGFAPTEPH
jgi:hypothetical protein